MTGQFIINPRKIFIGTSIGDLIDAAYENHAKKYHKRFSNIFLENNQFSEIEKDKLKPYFTISQSYGKNTCLVINDQSIISILKALNTLGFEVEDIEKQERIIRTIETLWGSQKHEWLENEEFNDLPQLTQAVLALKHRCLYRGIKEEDKLNVFFKRAILASTGRKNERFSLLSSYNRYKQELKPRLSIRDQVWTPWKGITSRMANNPLDY